MSWLKLNRRTMGWQQQRKPDYMVLDGGLDLVTPPLEIAKGRLLGSIRKASADWLDW